MIQTYYGNGKGKTTAACGAAVRAVGNGMRVCWVGFFKDGSSCECAPLKAMGVELLIPAVGYALFEEDAQKRIERAACYRALLEGLEGFDLIVLDEVLDTVPEHFSAQELVELLTPLEKNSELILTGHRLPEPIAQMSDYLSKITAEKHPFDRGIAARRGIEY